MHISFNSLIVDLLVGIAVGVGVAAALLTYRQCRQPATGSSDSQRQDALERFKTWTNFWKYFLGSFALVLITTLLSNTLKERELALQKTRQDFELALEKEKQASASLIAENDNLGKFLDVALDENWQKQYAFASYFGCVTSDEKARERWSKYASLIQETHKNALDLAAQKETTATALSGTSLDSSQRAEDEKKLREIQSKLELATAILGTRLSGPFIPGCELPFKGRKNPAIDYQCGIEGGSNDSAKRAQSRVENNFCAATHSAQEISYEELITLQSRSASIPKGLVDRSVLVKMGEGSYVSYNDGSHLPCSGTSRPNPRRKPVWEIHPVYSVEVCDQPTIAQCRNPTSKWSALSGAPSHGNDAE